MFPAVRPPPPPSIWSEQVCEVNEEKFDFLQPKHDLTKVILPLGCP